MLAAGAAVYFGAGDAARSEDSVLEQLILALSAPAAEGVAGLERKFARIDPALAGFAAPVVAGLIAGSRDDAIARGVEPIPDTIRAELEGYVPNELLDRVRWCVDCGGELSLQRNTFRLGIAPAITLGDVIVFRDRHAALHDAALWVHELKHVMQFDDWGIAEFASRYLEDYEAVEREAAEFRWEWVQGSGWLARRADRGF